MPSAFMRCRRLVALGLAGGDGLPDVGRVVGAAQLGVGHVVVPEERQPQVLDDAHSVGLLIVVVVQLAIEVGVSTAEDVRPEEVLVVPERVLDELQVGDEVHVVGVDLVAVFLESEPDGGRSPCRTRTIAASLRRRIPS